MAQDYCGVCCKSFSTWWAIMDQYKDFKEIEDLDHWLLRVVAKVLNK